MLDPNDPCASCKHLGSSIFTDNAPPACFNCGAPYYYEYEEATRDHFFCSECEGVIDELWRQKGHEVCRKCNAKMVKHNYYMRNQERLKADARLASKLAWAEKKKEKKKPMTEAQRQARSETNRKYYQKRKALLQPEELREE